MFPASSDENGKLTGLSYHQPIAPGVNISQCGNKFDKGFKINFVKVQEHNTPSPDCSCGFYVYDDPDLWWNSAPISKFLPLNDSVPVGEVKAVVKISGKVLVCERGLRVENIEVVAATCHKIDKETLENSYPDVRLFENLSNMLSEYPITTFDRPNRPGRITQKTKKKEGTSDTRGSKCFNNPVLDQAFETTKRGLRKGFKETFKYARTIFKYARTNFWRFFRFIVCVAVFVIPLFLVDWNSPEVFGLVSFYLSAAIVSIQKRVPLSLATGFAIFLSSMYVRQYIPDEYTMSFFIVLALTLPPYSVTPLMWFCNVGGFGKVKTNTIAVQGVSAKAMASAIPMSARGVTMPAKTIDNMNKSKGGKDNG